MSNNNTCPTRPVSDSSNAQASTSFVHNLIGSASGSAFILNIAALKAITPVANKAYIVEGYYAAGDGGGGEFYGVTGAAPGTYVDNGGTVILPSGGDGSTAWLRNYANIINVKWFGAKGDGTTDDTTTINAAITAAAGISIFFPQATYKFTSGLVFNNIDADFQGSNLYYAGAPGSFALTLTSNSGAGLNQTCGNIFQNFTLYQSDFSNYTTLTASTTWDPPSVAGGAAISNISPGGASTTVNVPGATTGGYARATLSTLVDGMILTAWVSAADTVTVWLSNYTAGAIDLGNGTLDVTVVNNAYHGLCIGGSLGDLHNVKIRGFTGVSFGLGDGRDPVSGVLFSGIARAFYWDADVNVAAAAGWAAIIPPRNNENEFSFTTFPLDAYSDPVPKRDPTINQLVIGGLTNYFRQLSLESSSSEETVIFMGSANGNATGGIAYVEYNTNYVTPPFPRIRASVSTSSNQMTFRHPYNHGSEVIIDNGTANQIFIVPSNYVNGSQVLYPTTSRNIIVNGDFENGTNKWSNFSAGSVLTIPGVGYLSGKRVRLDLVAGRPNLQQDIQTVSGLQIAGFAGQNVTVSGWLKSNLPFVKFRLGGLTGNGGTVGDETWEFISTTVKVPSGTATLPLSVITEASNLTGYVEISNVTAYFGVNAAAVGEQTNPVGSATYNPPSIAAAGTTTTTVTVTGAVLGDYAEASFSLDLAGLMLTSYVSAADTVTCVFFNPTTGAIDLASGTLRCIVTKS